MSLVTTLQGENYGKQLNDVHNMSWNAIGPQDPPEIIPVYAAKSSTKVNKVDVKTALSY